MKKYLSLTLILGMMLTLVSIIPAEAKAFADYPYIYSDFENQDFSADGIASSNTLTWTQGGAHGSKGALHIEQTNSSRDVNFTMKDAAWLKGGSFRMSAWVKADAANTTFKKFQFGVIMYAQKGSTIKYEMMNFDTNGFETQIKSGDWFYVQYDMVNWDGLMNSSSDFAEYCEKVTFCPRLGDYSGGSVANATDSGKVCWYIDDFKVEPIKTEYVPPVDGESNHAEPYATDLSISGDMVAGQTLTLNYTYNSDAELDEGNTVVRVIKELAGGKGITLAQIKKQPGVPVTYTIPDAVFGSKLRFEVLPATVAGNDGKIVYGAVYKTTSDVVKAEKLIQPTLNDFDAVNNTITGKLTVENNLSDAETLNLVLVVVVCDADGGLIQYGSKAISVAGGDDDEITLSVSTAVPTGMGVEVANAKAYVWGFPGEVLEGENAKELSAVTVFDTNMVSYAEPVVVEK